MENQEQTPIEQVLKTELEKLIKDTQWHINYHTESLAKQKMLLEIYTNQLTQLN